MTEETQYNYTPLPEAIPITEQKWPEGTIPLVHTRTMTYMHENYIRDCIEGILMQKTTFPVQVLIHDDASTDKTPEIVKEYEQKYPRLIKAYYQKENSHTKKDKIERRAEFLSWRIGKYEALCEGDDYWTDSLKLQRQVEFLERNPEFSLSTHDYIIKYEHKDIPEKVRSQDLPYLKKQIISHEDAYKVTLHQFCKYLAGIHTATIVYKTEFLRESPPWAIEIFSGDFVRNIQLLKQGDGAFIPDIMSVLRKNPQGITQQKRNGEEQFAINSRKFYLLARNVPGKNKFYFYIRLFKVYIKLAYGDKLYKMPLITRIKKAPGFFQQTFLIVLSFFK